LREEVGQYRVHEAPVVHYTRAEDCHVNYNYTHKDKLITLELEIGIKSIALYIS
jgi:hypothetical protein